LTSGPHLSVPRCGVGGGAAGAPNIFKRVFRKGLMKMIFRNYENTFKNHILRIIASKMMKQILVVFLGVDI
jgi:hypothetical protein